MIIQCPACKSRYRTRVLSGAQSTLSVNCPKCSHQFLVDCTAADSDVDTQQQTILLVDDARFFRDLMLDLLKERKVNLLCAENAEDAWVTLHRQQVDLLIVDINLPGKDGLDLVRDIRADSELKSLPVLCISGVHRREADAKNAIRAGADDFLGKSFKPDELAERVDKLLGR